MTWFEITGVRTTSCCPSSMWEFIKNVFIWPTIDESYPTGFLLQALYAYYFLYYLTVEEQSKRRWDSV